MKWLMWIRLVLEILKLFKGKDKKDVSTKKALKSLCDKAIDNLGEMKRCEDCKNKGVNCIIACNLIAKHNYARKKWKVWRSE